jgi:uncharacterized membrane protein YbhN (UPF0104 family)
VQIAQGKDPIMQLKKFASWFLKSDQPKAQRARRVARLIIVFGLFIAMFWFVPVDSVFQLLLKTDPLLFLIGVILNIVSIFLTSVQMKPLLDNQGIDRSLTQIFKINWVVKFYSFVMPSSLVASGIRWYRFAQPEGKGAESLVTLAFFRLFRTFLVLMTGLGFLLISIQQNYTFRVGWIVLFSLGIIIIWVVVTRYSIPIYTWFRKHAGFILDRPILGSPLSIIEKLLTSASAYADMPGRDLLYSMSAGVLATLVGIVSGVYLARAIGIDLDFLELGWTLSILTLATQFSFTMMEGLGVREVTLVALLSLFNISSEQALAFSLLIFARGLITALLGGVIEALDALRNRRSTELDTLPSESKKI